MILERTYDDDRYYDYWLDKATRGYEPEWLNAAISATVLDKDTEDTFDVYFVYTDKSGEYTMGEFKKFINNNAVELVYDNIDNDPRFEDYLTFENLDVVIDDIDFYTGRYED